MQTNSAGRTMCSLALCAVLAVGGSAFAQDAAVTDSQVEANVLKALASAPELANESIRTTTVYGTVTLSGNVSSEALRSRAENLAAGAGGVKKVVDELALGSATAAAGNGAAADGVPAGMVLQSDGTMVRADSVPAQAAPAPQQQQAQPVPQQQAAQPQYQGPDQRRAMSPYGAPPAGYAQQAPPPYGGQQAGLTVNVPTGTMLRVRVNQRLSSKESKPGSVFDGIVANDVVADGEVAIPRGAAVRGTVIDAKASGALAGRGELSVQLTQVFLGGKTYNITSEVWAHNGADKTVETVNKTAGFGAVGALLGAVAGGGAGAAIGGGIGAAAGLGSSASSGRGQVIIPSEGIVSFRLAQQVAVVTVSEQEMQRLAYGVPVGAQPNYPPRPRGYYPYPPIYYSPYPYYPR